jgi:hypothetical protein
MKKALFAGAVALAAVLALTPDTKGG